MSPGTKKYRFLLIPAFRLPGNSRFLNTVSLAHRPEMPKEQRLANYNSVKHLLEDVEWDLHEGALAPYGDWAVENSEERCLVGAARLPIVREACESGKYNAIILLGGVDPGFPESREIARKYNIPVTTAAFSQMHVASMLGNKFSIIDKAETSIKNHYNLVVQYHFTRRCASIRNINCPHPRPGYTGGPSLRGEEEKTLRGEPSEVFERIVAEAVAAIEEDGAEVITLGCSALFWVKPYLQERLNKIGWDIPVLDGLSCAITLAKTFVDLGVDASGLTFPSDRPKKWRRRKIF